MPHDGDYIPDHERVTRRNRQFIARGEAQLRSVAGLLLGLNPSKAWRVEIAQHQARRTVSQNKLVWAIYTEIASDTGHTADEIHEYCKAKFLPKRVVSFDGVDTEITGSTALLDKPAFSEYVERVTAWAAQEFGIQV